MADYPISAVHVLEIRKIKISDGNRFRTFMSFLIPAMLVKGADTAEHTVHLFDAITNITAWNPMKRLHMFFGGRSKSRIARNPIGIDVTFIGIKTNNAHSQGSENARCLSLEGLNERIRECHTKC